jgi:ABC-type antimicrobial peptide transport system permease subunit
MLRNYIKTAFRNLGRRKNYTIINIAGLAAGIAICLVLFIVIRYEMSFDDYHGKKDRIYRVLTEYHHADAPDIFYGRGIPYPMPEGLKANFPQVETLAPVYADNNDQLLITDENGSIIKKFKEENGVFFTTPSFFNIFDFPLLSGSYATLKEPNNVLIAKETAEKYFGDWKTAMGKTIRLKSSYGDDVLKVSGILATIPANTDFQVKLAVAYGTGFTGNYIAKSTNWDGTGSAFGCYLLLRHNTSVGNFNQQLRAYSKKVKSPENKDSHIIQPLKAVHYDTQAGNNSNNTISRELLNALWLIGAFILLIACVNFINLSTAQAVNRSKEVGIRKVLGSNRQSLKIQFLTETFLIVVISVLAAVGIAMITVPLVGKILDMSISFNVFVNPMIVLFLLILTVVVTILAGFYPSIVLAKFNPVTALKNKMTERSLKGISLRRGLVVFQFVIAQALIIGTLIIIKQMNYFTSQPLGFEKEAIINVPFPSDSANISKLDYLRSELSVIKGVQQVSFSSNTPVEDNNDSWTTFRFDHAAKETDFYAINKSTDYEYVPTYRLPLVAGRNLHPSDTVREFLVNETLVKSLGITDPQLVLNKEINLWNGQFKGVVVGILKDFHDRSFRTGIAPVMMTTYKGWYNSAGIKLSSEHALATVEAIEKTWNRIFPDFVFEYKFLDDKIESFYKEENRLSYLYRIFAAIAIFLSCLGLYGLASFMAVQRIKEVGIRKVLGASVSNVIYLFSKEFIILIAIAFVIASPIAWYFMDDWLRDYPYRINLSWWIFLAGGIGAIIIALITVSFQAIKAAIANPVKSLRTE